MTLVSIPFDGGMNEGIDTALLPQGVFRKVENMRLRRDGQLIPRPRLTALAMATGDGNTLEALDLLRYREQLLAIGRDSDATADALLNVWSYTDRTVATWDRVDNVVAETSVPRLPLVTNVRDIPRPLPSTSGVSQAAVAAGGGYVCTVWAGELGEGYVLVQRVSDGAQILYQALPSAAQNPYILPRVIYVNSCFVIAAADTDDDIMVTAFNPEAMTSLTSPATILSGSALTSFELSNVRGSSNGFVIVASNSTPTLQIRGSTITSGGTVTASGLFATVTIDAVTAYSDVTITADNTAGVFVAARISATGLVSAWTYSIAGAAVVGPTADIFGAAGWANTGTQLYSCVLDVGGAARAVAATSGAETSTLQPVSRFVALSFAAHTTIVSRDWDNSYITAGLLPVDLGNRTCVLFGAELEYFYIKKTASTGTQDFQGSSNALCQLLLDATYESQTVTAVVDQGLAGAFPLNSSTDAGTVRTQGGNIAQDDESGKCYWVRLVADILTMVVQNQNLINNQPAVAEFDVNSTERRQTAELDSQLIVTGGYPLIYAGSALFVEPGFETPQILSGTASNSTGTLTNSGVYSWVVVFRWIDSQGRVHLSPPSKPIRATLGATDDTYSLVVSTPHSRKYESAVSSVPCVELYRTQNNGATFRLVSRTSVTGDFGAAMAITDTSPDTTIAGNPILYTQNQTPVPHHLPPPAKYVAAGRSRIVLGGTNDETEVVFSKLVFPGEPIEFAPPGLLGYRKSIGEPVTAVMSLDEQVLVASEKALYRIAGSGADHSGQGEFLDPERIPGLGGVSNWRSVVEVPTGYFFQSANDKLYHADRSGAISWVQGQAVRDTLDSYPVIVAAVFVRSQNCVFFACQNPTNTSASLLVFDLRRECWYVDTETAVINGVSGLAEYDGRLALVSGGNVYLETVNSYHASGVVTTGHIRNGSLCAWNRIKRIGVRGTVIGVATPSVTLEADLEHEDANVPGFQSFGTHSPTEGIGDAFTKFWTPPNQKLSSIQLRITAADVRLNELVLDIEPRRGIARRKPADLK